LQHGLNGLRGRPPEMESRFDSDRRSQKQRFEIRHKWEDIEEYTRVERNKVRAKGQEFFVDIIGIKYIYRGMLHKIPLDPVGQYGQDGRCRFHSENVHRCQTQRLEVFIKFYSDVAVQKIMRFGGRLYGTDINGKILEYLTAYFL